MSTPQSLNVCIQSFEDEAGYVAWIDNSKFKGMVVQAGSLKETLKELLISLKVKVAYDYGIPIGGFEAKLDEMVRDAEAASATNCENTKEISLGGLCFA